jgi:D-alanine--D-alanine ligase
MKVEMMDISEGFLEKLRRFRPRVAFLALHGAYGEDGRIQAELDAEGVKYTGSGPMASLVAMDKEICKRAFARKGLRTPASRVLSRGAGVRLIEDVLTELAFPLVVKPTASGSSRGVSVARNRLGLLRGLKKAGAFGRRILLESYVEGRELNVAILGSRNLPLVEVIPREEFFSYEAKYESPFTKSVVNPDLPDHIAAEIRQMAHEAFEEIGCRHFGRVEFILGNDGLPYIIEVNTLPGMTKHSLFPLAARAGGLSFEAVCKEIARLAL